MNPAQSLFSKCLQVEGGQNCLFSDPGPTDPTLSWEQWTHPAYPETWPAFQGPQEDPLPAWADVRQDKEGLSTRPRQVGAGGHLPGPTWSPGQPMRWLDTMAKEAKESGSLGAPLPACLPPGSWVLTCSLRLGWAVRP